MKKEKKKCPVGSLFLLADLTTWCLSYGLHKLELH